MTVRKPLVRYGGRIRQLGAGDYVPASAIYAAAVEPANSYSMPAGSVQAILEGVYYDTSTIWAWQEIHTSGIAGIAHTATSISNVPAGGITETNVQAALNGLDSKKLSKSDGAGLRNYAVNGNFDFWQRAATSTHGGALLTTADRFWVGTYGSNGTVERVANAPGSAAQLNTGATYKLRVTGTAGNAYDLLSQRLESVVPLAGKTITVSIYCDTTKPTGAAPYFRVVQAFGSGGSTAVTTDTALTQVAGENGDFRWVATVSVPSISGKTVGAGSYMEVALIWVPDTDTAAFGFYGFQVEQGSVATPFERRHFAVEYDLCRRYFRTYATAQNTANLAYEMRGTPVQTGAGPYFYDAEL